MIKLDKLNKNDLWMTPESAVNVIVPYLKKYVSLSGKKSVIIWCPFDTNESRFVSVLSKIDNVKVVYSHLDSNQDFFQYEPKQWDVIISNPPWSIKWKVMERCYKFNKPFALLLPIHFISSKGAWGQFHNRKLQLLMTKNRVCYLQDSNDVNENKGHNRPPFESAYFASKFFPQELNYEKEDER